MRRSVWTALLAVVLVPGVCRAGAWLQEPGTSYARLTVGYLSTDRRLDENGDSRPFLAGGGFRDVGYRDVDAGYYTEVGLHPRWNVVANVLWKHVEAEQPSAVFTTWGFSDLSVGLKGLLARGAASVASAMGVVVLPLGYEPEEYPSLGSGVTDLLLGLQAGTSNARFWANAEGWFKLRGGAFRNQVAGAVTAGVGSGGRLGLRAEARGEVPVGSPAPDSDSLRFDPNQVDPSILDLAATVSVRVIEVMAVEAEVRSTVWGRNTLDGTRFYLGLATGRAIRLWENRP